MRISDWKRSVGAASGVAFCSSAAMSRKSRSTAATLSGVTCPKICLSICTATASMQQPRQATLLSVNSLSGDVSSPSAIFRYDLKASYVFSAPLT